MKTATILVSAIIVVTSTLAHAAGTPEQRRACRADAMRLCRQFVPRVAEITRCMERNSAKLTPACRAQFK
ncbi:MAG TPA: hypothetical protein VHC94_20160 [Nitrobacter sp.]|jgi:hypothetical protein|nr:hypothetical protein [Nitrobacter sp.]